MGCSNSKVDNEEGVARCKQRKRLMKQTVTSRHNLAASHAMFVISLKGVGSAFRTFAEGEVKDVDSQTLCSTETPNTPRTPPLKLGPSSVLPPEPRLSSGIPPSFSPSPPPHSPLSPHVRLSALRLQTGSPIIRAVSSPDSVTMDFLPPPPPPITFSKEYRMEHTPPIIPTKIHKFEDVPNSYLKTYRMEDSPPPSPLIQPIQIDDDWRYSGRTPLFNGVRDNNPPPPPPPPATRSSWQDLFMDPFRPSPPSYNYMEERRNQDAEEHRRRHESEQRSIHEAEQRKVWEAEQRRKKEVEQRRIHEEHMRARDMEERRTRELEQKRLQEMEQRRPPPPVKIHEVKPIPEVKQKNLEHEVPALEEDDIPELEDVEEDFVIDEPPPQDLHVEKVVKQPEPEPVPAPAPAPAPKPEPVAEIKPEPVTEIKPELVTEVILEPEIKPEPEIKSEVEIKSEPEIKSELEIKPEPEIKPVPEPEPVTPPKTAPQTPPKVQEQPPKVVKTVKAPTPGKPPGKPPKPEAIAKTNKQIAVAIAEKGGRDLIDILREVDDCFLKAAECGENVSRILETKKTHYHSTFSDNWRGVGESARMSFRKLSGRAGSGSFRTTSFRTSSNVSSMSNSSVLTDDSASIMSMRRSLSNLSSQRFTEECGLINSHAATLDRLFAWEKKLYKEVKEAEAVRNELEKKFSLFRNQDHKNEDQTIIDKTRFSIKALQTRMVVAIEAVDNGARQVQRLRDEELYQQLLELLDGMGAMWKEMSVCHQAQLRAVEAIRSLDNSAAYEPTTSSQRHSTTQLEVALNKWSEGLNRVVRSQRDYMKNLTSWLRLSLMQFSDEVDSGSRSGSGSPSRSPRSPQFSMGLNASPIYGLCRQWKELLDQVADKVALEAIGSFSNVVKEMLRLQCEELRIKKKVENYVRELERREQALQNASNKDAGSAPPGPPSKSPTTTSGSDMDDRAYDMVVSQGFPERTEVTERRLKYEVSRRKLEDEREALRKATTDTRACTLNSLQAGLPQLFQAVIAFANMEAEVYDKLNSTGPLLNR